MDYDQRHSEARLEIVEGLLRALNSSDVLATIHDSSDSRDAMRRLQLPPLGFSPTQAIHIPDMTLHRRTALGRLELETEVAELRSLLDPR